jgi:gamma-glutamyltranspeptidase / glutathione hydrolase
VYPRERASVVLSDGPVRSPATRSGRSTVYAPGAAVATSQPLATSAGLEMLWRGGNAVDAAIAAAAVLNVVEPHMTGIGGDAFAILWSGREKRLVGLTAAGGAGALMTADEIRRRGHEGVPQTGGGSITVPGALAGWSGLLERYGRFGLDTVLRPAIRLAEQGFPVSPIIARDWAAETARLGQDPGSAATFLDRHGSPPGAGTWFTNPDLAASLRAIADEGPGTLYGGELGRRVVEAVRDRGGFLLESDFASMRPEWVDPIAVPFRGMTVHQLPPPGQGVAALQMLRLVEEVDLARLGHNSAEYLHLLIEAKKLAFEDVARNVGDPRSMTVDPATLLSDDHLEPLRRRLAAGGEPASTGHDDRTMGQDTVYLATADADGTMVSFINSVFSRFGSGVTAPGTGFVLQNRGAGFVLSGDHPNGVAPGKRPFHTLIPGFVTRAVPTGLEPWMAFGVMGGSMQPQGHLQLLLNLLVFDMDPQESLDAVRFRHLEGASVALEVPLAAGVAEALTRRGHQCVRGGDFGGGQLVIRLERGYAAASDVRKDGHAAGF